MKASCKTEAKALRGVNHMNGNDTIGGEIALLHNCITAKIITAAPRPEEIEFAVEEWATYCNVANNFLMKTSMNYPIIYIEPEFPTVSNEEQEILFTYQEELDIPYYKEKQLFRVISQAIETVRCKWTNKKLVSEKTVFIGDINAEKLGKLMHTKAARITCTPSKANPEPDTLEAIWKVLPTICIGIRARYAICIFGSMELAHNTCNLDKFLKNYGRLIEYLSKLNLEVIIVPPPFPYGTYEEPMKWCGELFNLTVEKDVRWIWDEPIIMHADKEYELAAVYNLVTDIYLINGLFHRFTHVDREGQLKTIGAIQMLIVLERVFGIGLGYDSSEKKFYEEHGYYPWNDPEEMDKRMGRKEEGRANRLASTETVKIIKPTNPNENPYEGIDFEDEPNEGTSQQSQKASILDKEKLKIISINRKCELPYQGNIVGSSYLEQVAVEMWERYYKGIKRGCRKEIRPSLIHDEIGRDIVTTEQYIEKYGEEKLNKLLEKAARPKIYRKNKIRNLNKPVIKAYHKPAARLNSFPKRNQIPSSPHQIPYKVPYQGANVLRAPIKASFITTNIDNVPTTKPESKGAVSSVRRTEPICNELARK